MEELTNINTNTNKKIKIKIKEVVSPRYNQEEDLSGTNSDDSLPPLIPKQVEEEAIYGEKIKKLIPITISKILWKEKTSLNLSNITTFGKINI